MVEHLAVIMDGNRRWAKERGLVSIEGHRAGVTALKSLVKACPEYGINYLTVYAFSTENWKRNSQELDFLFNLLGEMAVSELNSLVSENIKVSYIGDISAFDSGLFKKLEALQEKTKNNTGLNLQIALNYGALDEFVRTLNHMKENFTESEITNLNVESFTKLLDTKNIPTPEILIRTGGEARLSNYLLWQCASAELFFTEILWPSFSKQDLAEILSSSSCKGSLSAI